MLATLPSLILAALAATQIVGASPLAKRCTYELTSYSAANVAAAKKCAIINISAFTMPSKTTLDLTGLITGTVVTLKGNLNVCGKVAWADGPCVSIGGTSVTFNGGGYTLDGNGASFWDTLGSNTGASAKPKFISVTMSGTFSDLYIKNTPRHVFSIGNKAQLTVSDVHIDNTAGNTLSGGKTLGHNTDCFDVSASDVTITKSSCDNQDDCLAINSGDNIKFTSNTCNGGHGISIGSVATGKVVSNVVITSNVVTNSDNGLRIKTISGATGASVNGVTYTGNTVTAAANYGVVIEQDYLNGGATGKPTSGVPIKNINFVSGNKVTVGSKGKKVYVLCGTGTCTGTWNWSGLTASGGVTSSITPSTVPITGFSL